MKGLFVLLATIVFCGWLIYLAFRKKHHGHHHVSSPDHTPTTPPVAASAKEHHGGDHHGHGHHGKKGWGCLIWIILILLTVGGAAWYVYTHPAPPPKPIESTEVCYTIVIMDELGNELDRSDFCRLFKSTANDQGFRFGYVEDIFRTPGIPPNRYWVLFTVYGTDHGTVTLKPVNKIIHEGLLYGSFIDLKSTIDRYVEDGTSITCTMKLETGQIRKILVTPSPTRRLLVTCDPELRFIP